MQSLSLPRFHKNSTRSGNEITRFGNKKSESGHSAISSIYFPPRLSYKVQSVTPLVSLQILLDLETNNQFLEQFYILDNYIKSRYLHKGRFEKLISRNFSLCSYLQARQLHEMYVDSYINWDFEFTTKIYNFQCKKFCFKLSQKTEDYLENFSKWQKDLFFGI